MHVESSLVVTNVTPPTKRNRGVIKALLIYGCMGLAALTIACLLRSHIPMDDAAISFRYAKRLVGGHGLTYNDTERVMGYSNPLYTIILAGFYAIGVNIEGAAVYLGILLYTASILLTVAMAKRLSNWIGGILAGTLLLLDTFYRGQCLSGMESVMCVCIGLACIISIMDSRESLAGILLGLAIFNKLDASLLAVPIALSFMLMVRKFPTRIALVSFAIYFPWVMLSWFYYGSPIPHSLTTKLLAHGPLPNADHYWILNFLLKNSTESILVVLSLASSALIVRLEGTRRIGLTVLLLWFLFHAITYSALNFGDNYAWYLTVLIPPIAILGGAYLSSLPESFGSRRVIGYVLLVPLSLFIMYLNAQLNYSDLMHGNSIKRWEAFNNDRRMAGVFVQQFSDSTEVLESAFGWDAAEVSNPYNDNSFLNTVKSNGSPAYIILHGVPNQLRYPSPTPPFGDFIPLATLNLASDLFPGETWFSVYGRSDSRIATSRKRYIQLRLFELEKVNSSPQGVPDPMVHFENNDLLAADSIMASFVVVNHGQPVSVLYIPSVESPNLDSVDFQIWQDSEQVDEFAVHASKNPPVRITRIQNSRMHDSFQISFLTHAIRPAMHAQNVVKWKDVKIIVGEAIPDERRIYDSALRDEWNLFNPSMIRGTRQ